MSYTHHSGIATCTITNVLDTNDLISQVYDYLTNHENEVPDNLEDCASFEEFADILESYVQIDDGVLTITIDTEESNCDGEIFDFLADHYAHLMTSKFMKMIWISYDSRAGLSAECTYFDNAGEIIDIETLLQSR